MTPISRRRASCQRQSGAATLVVALLLSFAMTLVVAYANRNLVYEHKASANQYRSTQAFEAAEAGLEWALAQINSNASVGADCKPSAAAGSTSFRERYLAYDAATERHTPRTWSNAGNSVALAPSCVRTDSGWACSCPSAGQPQLQAPAGAGAHPAFSLQFIAAGRSGIVHLAATGCDALAGACVPGGNAAGAATARVHFSLGLVPALATPPAAPLTARGSVALGAEIGVHNTDPAASGITVDAGNSITLPLAHLGTAPGSPLGASLIDHDASLAALDAKAMFGTFLGLDKARWRQQPGVQTITCPADCTAELSRALGQGTRLLWVRTDLRLDGDTAIGSPERPVLLVVEGQVQLSGGVVIHGVVYVAAPQWDSSASNNALVRGALIAEGNVAGNGTPELFYDAAVLARLRSNAGTFTRVAGSWRDF